MRSSVLWCPLRRSVRHYLQLFVGELISCLFWFRLFALSCVQHILVFLFVYLVYCSVRHVLWCVFCLFVFVLCLVCPMLPVSLDCPFLISPFGLLNVYLYGGNFPLVIHSWIHVIKANRFNYKNSIELHEFIEFALIIIKVKQNHAVKDCVWSFCHYLDDKICLNLN
jgi:hypothetical protein